MPVVEAISVEKECKRRKVQKTTSVKSWERNTRKAMKDVPPTPDLKPWSERKMLLGVSRSDRVLSLVNCAMQREVMASGEAVLQAAQPDVYIDVSQDICRTPWTRSTVRSLTTSSCLYSSKADRQLLAKEHLRLVGFVSVPPNYTEAEYRDLAGECMAPPVIGHVIGCLLKSVQFPGLFATSANAIPV